jgi:hypothetical protein
MSIPQRHHQLYVPPRMANANVNKSSSGERGVRQQKVSGIKGSRRE